MNYGKVLKARVAADRLLGPEALSMLLAARLGTEIAAGVETFMTTAVGEIARVDFSRGVRRRLDWFRRALGDAMESRAGVAGALIREYARRAYARGKREGEKLRKSEEPGGLQFGFNTKDERALAALEQYARKFLSAYYSGWGEFGSSASEILAELLQRYYEEGMTDEELSEELGRKLGDYAQEMQTKMKTAVGHWIFKLAQYGSVAGYEASGIEYAEVVAVIDSKTTDICRRMHGRIIPVGAMRAQLDSALSAGGTGEGLERTHRMFSQKDWKEKLSGLSSTADLLRAGAIMPPYHFNCRTRTVAYFEPGGFKGYSRARGERAKEGGLTDQEIKNFSDELGRRVKERKLYWEPGRLESHARDHAKEFGLEKGDAQGYENKLYELLENAGTPLMNLYKGHVQFAFQQGRYIIVVAEGYFFKSGFENSKQFFERELLGRGIYISER